MFDVIIIGAGPAGITASLYLQRANYKTLVLHNNMSNLQKAVQIDNYYGSNSVSGSELYNNGIKQAQNLGVTVLEEEVIDISLENEYIVKTQKKSYTAQYVILSTGKKKEMYIPGMKNYIGMGVSYCAICDAFFYKNKEVALIGNGLYATHERKILEKVCKKVYHLYNDASQNLKYSLRIKRIEKTEKMKIFFEDDQVLEVDGIFVANGINSVETLTKTLGLISKNGFITVDENQRTNLRNFYVCGDLTGGILQITKATYEGMKAALDIIKKGDE